MEDQRWLTERESSAWRAFLVMRRALDRGLDRQLSRDAGLSGADYQLLVPLSEAPDQALRARDLGREVDWERSRLSHQLRRMEQRGLISRQDCPTDARGTIIVLTALGVAAIKGAAPSHVNWVREHFIALLNDGELDLLRALSERVLSVLASEGCPEAACGEEGCPSSEPIEVTDSDARCGVSTSSLVSRESPAL
ncbi:MAG: MarR family winged helix-turn-helix transcriptional regulator [Acidimicrobiales bacterium]